jgi:sugar/nucleoside kinase (ribokinase family)
MGREDDSQETVERSQALLHPPLQESNIASMREPRADQREGRVRKRVCCLGSINLDVSLRLDRLPVQHEKLEARESRVSGGGSAANTAVWLARQGLSVEMRGWIGDDALGTIVLADLRANGVDTRGVKTLPVASPIAVCLAPPGDKRIIISPIVAAPWTPYDHEDSYEDVDWLHTTVGEAAFLRHAKRASREKGTMLSVEMDGRYDPAFASTADYLFTNSDERARQLGTRDLAGFIKEKHGADPAIWFVTQGEQGVMIIAGGKVESVSAVSVDSVDRTGGGDAFNAGVIAALLAGADPLAAATAGLNMAGQALRRLGAH